MFKFEQDARTPWLTMFALPDPKSIWRESCGAGIVRAAGKESVRVRG
ncbi:MAG: hypothetical protein ABI702_04650 [Burkholderiales bacterium]